MKLWVINGLVGNRGGPKESMEVRQGMTVKLVVEGSGEICGTVESVFKSGVRIGGHNYHNDSYTGVRIA